MPGRLLLLSQAPSFSLTSPLCSLDCFSRLLCLHMLFLHVFTLFLVHFTTLSTWWTPLIFKVELKPHSFYEASSALLIFLVSIAPSAYLHCFLTLNDVVQFSCSVMSQLFETPRTAAPQASLSITNSQSLLKLMSIESVMPSNHLILSSVSPPAFNLSQHRCLFKWV